MRVGRGLAAANRKARAFDCVVAFVGEPDGNFCWSRGDLELFVTLCITGATGLGEDFNLSVEVCTTDEEVFGFREGEEELLVKDDEDVFMLILLGLFLGGSGGGI